MHIFNQDSPLMETLSRIADLVILNIVVMLCCLPVITAGAALTGMHYVLLKMARDQEGYIVRSYFKSFKQNFLQATGIWLLFLVLFGVFFLDLRLTGGGAAASGGAAAASGGAAVTSGGAAVSAGTGGIHLPPLFRGLLMAGGIYLFMVYLYVFPLLARFQNTAAGTLRNAATLVVAAFPRTVGMTLATFALPVAVWFFTPLFPLLLLVGISGPGFLCALLYSPLFAKMEKRVSEQTEE